MTGPEHYAEAERLLGQAGSERRSVSDATRRWLVDMAQVHATLALAAATLVGSESGYSSHRVEQWEPAMGPRMKPGPEGDPWANDPGTP